jgi:hypothetical protein
MDTNKNQRIIVLEAELEYAKAELEHVKAELKEDKRMRAEEQKKHLSTTISLRLAQAEVAELRAMQVAIPDNPQAQSAAAPTVGQRAASTGHMQTAAGTALSLVTKEAAQPSFVGSRSSLPSLTRDDTQVYSFGANDAMSSAKKK